MLTQLIAALLVVLTCQPQTTISAFNPPGQNDQPGHDTTITLATGTVVPLTLVNSIKSKSSSIGDAVRAEVAFPVTVGNQLAIPAGTYVEGTITSLLARPKHSAQPEVQIHFTRLLYTNGYTVELDASGNHADLLPPVAAPSLTAAAATPSGPSWNRYKIAPYESAYEPQPQAAPPTPSLAPLPSVGPSKALVFGSVLGGFAVLTALFVLSHHKVNQDTELFAPGWQFQMTLRNPVTIRTDKLSASPRTNP